MQCSLWRVIIFIRVGIGDFCFCWSFLLSWIIIPDFELKKGVPKEEGSFGFG
jgi:hypothetical protein